MKVVPLRILNLFAHTQEGLRIYMQARGIEPLANAQPTY